MIPHLAIGVAGHRFEGILIWNTQDMRVAQSLRIAITWNIAISFWGLTLFFSEMSDISASLKDRPGGCWNSCQSPRAPDQSEVLWR